MFFLLFFLTFNSGPHNPRIEAEVSCCRTGEVRKYSDLSEVVKTRVLSVVPVLPAKPAGKKSDFTQKLIFLILCLALFMLCCYQSLTIIQ